MSESLAPRTLILVDLSGSTRVYREELADAMAALANAHDGVLGHEVEVVGYTTAASLGQADWDVALYEGVDAVRDQNVGGGGTPTADALAKMAAEYEPHNIVLVTDGVENTPGSDERFPSELAIEQLMDAGIQVSVGIWYQLDSPDTRSELFIERLRALGIPVAAQPRPGACAQQFADLLGLGNLGLDTQTLAPEPTAPVLAPLEIDAISCRRDLPCGMKRSPSVFDPEGEWPVTITGWDEGVESSNAFDKALRKLVPEHLAGRIMTGSESNQIFIYAADAEAADWVERACEAISKRLSNQPTLEEKLSGLEI